MPHRLGKLTVLGIPLTGPQMQGRHLCGRALLQLITQGLGKEGVVGIPLTLVIKRIEKEIGPFQFLQEELAFLLLQDRITQGVAQAG